MFRKDYFVLGHWDYLTITLARYRERGEFGMRKLGPKRYAFDCRHWSLIIELWFLR